MVSFFFFSSRNRKHQCRQSNQCDERGRKKEENCPNTKRRLFTNKRRPSKFSKVDLEQKKKAAAKVFFFLTFFFFTKKHNILISLLKILIISFLFRLRWQVLVSFAEEIFCILLKLELLSLFMNVCLSYSKCHIYVWLYHLGERVISKD